MLEKFKKAALFLCTFRPTVHTNPSYKQRFLKTLFKPEEFENASFPFSCGQQDFENGLFQKPWVHDGFTNHVIFLTEFSSNTNPK